MYWVKNVAKGRNVKHNQEIKLTKMGSTARHKIDHHK